MTFFDTLTSHVVSCLSVSLQTWRVQSICIIAAGFNLVYDLPAKCSFAPTVKRKLKVDGWPRLPVEK